ncbi:MAG TPA: 4Fe-4S dicluster domain-containing protein [Spirochaetia bacterium]|nr:4Fe-4S dicluster domain-containing protein [Spirochaetia bacterium]
MSTPLFAGDPFAGALLQLLFAVCVSAALGGVTAVLIGGLSRVLSVRRDERVARLVAALPALDCGRCGYATCGDYARAVAKGEDAGRCMPGGIRSARLIGGVLGVEVRLTGSRVVAQVHCRGGRDVSHYRFTYTGLTDCTALHMLFGGDKECLQSCLGLGSCITVCPTGAIGYDTSGKVWVDRDLCISCGKCLSVCPTGVMKWVPADADLLVGCSSTDRAEQVAAYCSVGCTGCRLCERHSPAGGYHVDGNLSRLNYVQRGDRMAGAQACPTRCIIPAVTASRPEARPDKREVHE